MTVHISWRDDAACRDADPDLFFPVGTTGPALRHIDEAKRICRACQAPTTSAARLAVPRAAFAFPPRSLVAAISGVPRAGQMAAASAFRPRTSRLLPSIFVCPDVASCFWCPRARRGFIHVAGPQMERS